MTKYHHFIALDVCLIFSNAFGAKWLPLKPIGSLPTSENDQMFRNTVHALNREPFEPYATPGRDTHCPHLCARIWRCARKAQVGRTRHIEIEYLLSISKGNRGSAHIKGTPTMHFRHTETLPPSPRGFLNNVHDKHSNHATMCIYSSGPRDLATMEEDFCSRERIPKHGTNAGPSTITQNCTTSGHSADLYQGSK